MAHVDTSTTAIRYAAILRFIEGTLVPALGKPFVDSGIVQLAFTDEKKATAAMDILDKFNSLGIADATIERKGNSVHISGTNAELYAFEMHAFLKTVSPVALGNFNAREIERIATNTGVGTGVPPRS